MDNNEVKGCPRDCKKCSLQQQVYCSAQIALSTMDSVQSLSERFNAFVDKINGIFENQTLIEPKAQEGAAVQKIDSPLTTKINKDELQQ